MKSFKGFTASQEQRKEEEDQVTHEFAMNFMKQNRDAISDILLTKLKNGEVELDDIKDDIKPKKGKSNG